MGASISRLVFVALPTAAGRAFITRFGLANHDEVRVSSIVEFDEVNFKKAVTPPLVTLLSDRPRARKNSILLSYAYNPIDLIKQQIIESVAI